MLGLPNGVTACLFDLDGVLTDTAAVHAAAWKRTFDELLVERSEASGCAQRPFDHADYLAYVDGKPRQDGVRDFLNSRDIHLPEGELDDPPGSETINAVGNRKNVDVLDAIRGGRVEVF